MPNPIENPNLYDYIVLAGQTSPGLAEIQGASNPRKWDEKAGKGVTGATLTYSGDALCSFSVVLSFWELQHFAQWDKFKELLSKPTNAKNPQALDISHPDLEGLNIKSVVVEDFTYPVQTDPGLWQVTIKFKQYRAPKPSGGTNVKGSKANEASGKIKDVPAPTAAELELAALLEQSKMQDAEP